MPATSLPVMVARGTERSLQAKTAAEDTATTAAEARTTTSTRWLRSTDGQRLDLDRAPAAERDRSEDGRSIAGS